MSAELSPNFGLNKENDTPRLNEEDKKVKELFIGKKKRQDTDIFNLKLATKETTSTLPKHFTSELTS